MKNLEICKEFIREQIIPNPVGKDKFNPQFRETTSLTLKTDKYAIDLASEK